MARSKITFPSKDALFITSIPVRITDINYGNHLGNDSLLSIIHESRMQFLNHYNFSELNVGGASLIMGESQILYKGESFYGDILTIKIWTDDITTAAFDLLYEVTTIRDNKTIIIAQAKTVMICYDYENRKTKAIPEALLAVIK